MSTSQASNQVFIRPSSTGSGYEIELQSAHGLAARGLPIWLQLGPVQLRIARESPTVGEYGTVFPLSQQQFDAVPDGAEVVLLSSTRGKGRTLGRLDKASLHIR